MSSPKFYQYLINQYILISRLKHCHLSSCMILQSSVNTQPIRIHSPTMRSMQCFNHTKLEICKLTVTFLDNLPDGEVHGANMGPTWAWRPLLGPPSPQWCLLRAMYIRWEGLTIVQIISGFIQKNVPAYSERISKHIQNSIMRKLIKISAKRYIWIRYAETYVDKNTLELCIILTSIISECF